MLSFYKKGVTEVVKLHEDPILKGYIEKPDKIDFAYFDTNNLVYTANNMDINSYDNTDIKINKMISGLLVEVSNGYV